MDAPLCFLLDLENVPTPSLNSLPAGARLIAFVRASQPRVSMDLLRAANSLKDRYELVEVSSKGEKNAMDFHIALELGRLLQNESPLRCVIVSNDTGFDPLVRYLNGKGYDVRRQSDVVAPAAKGAKPSAVQAANASRADAAKLAGKAVELLRAISAKARPRTMRSLRNKLTSDLSADLKSATSKAPVVDAIIQSLRDRKVIREEGALLKYELPG